MSSNRLRMMWLHKTGEHLPKVWDAVLERWVNAHGIGMIEDAIQKVVAAARNPETEIRNPPNIRDVARFAAVDQAEEDERGMYTVYMVRGRARAKFVYIDEHELLDVLRNAMRNGMSRSAMYDAVTDNETFEGCCADLVIGPIEFRQRFGGEPPADKVFVRESDPEWRLWDDYLRRTTGKGAPTNQRFGWYFPSRLPPVNKSA